MPVAARYCGRCLPVAAAAAAKALLLLAELCGAEMVVDLPLIVPLAARCGASYLCCECG